MGRTFLKLAVGYTLPKELTWLNKFVSTFEINHKDVPSTHNPHVQQRKVHCRFSQHACLYNIAYCLKVQTILYA